MTVKRAIIEGFPNYEVDSNGNVYSKPRHRTKGGLLKQNPTSEGYLAVSLGSGKTKMVHLLVAKAFLPNPSNLPQVNHKDGNKMNPKLDNLEWISPKGNTDHAIKTGLLKHAKGEKCAHKLKEAEVIEIKSTYKPHCRKFGTRALAKKYGVTQMAISAIVTGKNWKHIEV